MRIRFGCTRYVFLTKKHAIKIPQFKYSWRLFLLGLLANMQESQFSKIKDDRLCPVLFSITGGLLIVMPRCNPITREEFLALDIEKFWTKDTEKNNTWYIPVENKEDSFGWYKGRIVAVDYGS